MGGASNHEQSRACELKRQVETISRLLGDTMDTQSPIRKDCMMEELDWISKGLVNLEERHI
jgi:hypothetical protein